MRYATVVGRRMLTRLLDDWNRRRLEHSSGTGQHRVPRPEAGSPLRLLVGQLAAFLVMSVRFLAVASSPTSPAGTSAAADLATRTPAPSAKPGARRTIVRLLANDRAQPYVDGAHPVTDAAIRRDTVTTTSHAFVALAAIRRFAPTLVTWLRPIVGTLGFNVGTPNSVRDEAIAKEPKPSRFSGWLDQQRLVGAAVAVLVLLASVVGVNPVHGPAAATGNVLGAGSGPRLSVGGGGGGVSGGPGISVSVGSGTGSGSVTTDGGFGGLVPTPGLPEFLFVNSAAFGQTQATPDDASSVDPLADGLTTMDATTQAPDTSGPVSFDVEGFASLPNTGPDGIAIAQAAVVPSTDATNMGAFLADGTILKPIAVDTSAPDARTLLTHYKVRKGDTLTSIAHHYGLSLQTLYWANHLTTNLKTKTDLKIGQTLSVPPVNGVLHIVTDRETLADISKRTGISVNKIVQANGLKQPTVFVGQWILVPGAKSKPVPEPPAPKPAVKATPKPVAKPATSSASTATKSTSKPVVKPVHVVSTGGGWVWPVPGGHISQYFHYGHWALDIAQTWGDPVVAARAGTVTFAGWKNNGGGWQVWISHGSGIYTTYNHMSSLTVHAGQQVGAGHQVGRIGATGDATGPHCHFEVWIGPIWAGGTRVNPLNYV